MPSYKVVKKMFAPDQPHDPVWATRSTIYVAKSGSADEVFEYDNVTEANTKRDELQAADDTRDFQVVKVDWKKTLI